MNPEKSFGFSGDNKERVKELLISFKTEQFANAEVSKLRLFDVFTNILIEALQFVGLIPYPVESEIEEVTKAVDTYNEIKNNLIDFKNLVV